VAFESNFVTLIGNLTDDPDLRFTNAGVAICKIRLAVNRRWKDQSGNDQEETSFVSANAWRDLGNNVGESLRKGDRVIVIGRLRIRSYEDKEGVTKWSTEIEADEISPSLRFATARPEKTNRREPAQVGSGFTAGVPPPSDDDVPF